MEAPYAAKDEFESLQEPMRVSTALSPRSDASWAMLDIGFRDALDEIYKSRGA